MFSDLLACPTCTLNRYLLLWPLFSLMRFGAVAWIARPHLDAVRTLAVACVLELPYFFLWRLGISTWYFDGPDVTPLEMFGAWYSWVFQSGILQALAILAASRIRLFRSAGSPPIGRRRPFLILPLFIGIHVLQHFLAFSIGSSTGL